jgi:ribose 5-phosphate isomerase B
MRVHLGSDHAGFELKARLVTWLAAHGHEPIDHGAATYDAEDDYPAFCLRAAAAVVADQMAGVAALGIVVGGSGNGEQISANKVDGVRAALAWSEETARLAREHNDANVVSIGARMHTPDEAIRFVEVFLGTPFSGGERHRRRIGQLADYERSRALPTTPAT